MLSFLPALILLLLHGPANIEGRLARACERADVGSSIPAVAPRTPASNRAFLAELLRKFPGSTLLAVLDTTEAIEAPEVRGTPTATPVTHDQWTGQTRTISSQRNRDGPTAA